LLEQEMVIHSGKTQAQVARELGCSEYTRTRTKICPIISVVANYRVLVTGIPCPGSYLSPGMAFGQKPDYNQDHDQEPCLLNKEFGPNQSDA
jgi:hypothetical protein